MKSIVNELRSPYFSNERIRAEKVWYFVVFVYFDIIVQLTYSRKAYLESRNVDKIYRQ